MLGTFVNLAKTPHLISGYQQMSEDDKLKFELIAFSQFFKQFHLYLGVSFLVLSLLSYHLLSDIYTGFFVISYPIFAYIYFVYSIQKFNPTKNKSKAFVSILVFSFIIIITAFMMLMGLQNNKMTISNKNVHISGIYSESFSLDEVEDISLLDTLPIILRKQNAYAIGDIKKGYFKLSNHEKIKLILNSNASPFIHIRLKSGKNIIYSINSSDNQRLYNELIQKPPY